MDPVALVAYLRSELMGFSDDDLYRFKRAGGVFDYRSDAPEELAVAEPELSRAVADAMACLRRYAGWIDRQYPPVVVIEKMLDDLGLLLHAGSGADADARIGALGRLVELMRAQQRIDFNAGDLLDLLRKIVADEVSFDVIPPRPYDEPPVRVMNLHKAKGLEAPVVFLASPVGGKPRQSRVHVDRHEGQPRGFMCCEHRAGQRGRAVAFPSDWELRKEIEMAFQDAETARLLYVAATRAGRALIVSTKPGRRSPSMWAPFEPFLAGARSLASIPMGEAIQKTPAVNDGVDGLELAPLAGRLAALRMPTHAIRSAKTFALANGQPVETSAGGLGQQWGSAVHHVLEVLMRDSDADASMAAGEAAELYTLGDLAEATGQLTSDLIDQLVAVGVSVMRSDILARARQAEHCLIEVPYVRRVADAPVATLERGVIDLAFREPAGWVLVDYKTDAAAKDNPQGVLEHYRPQLEIYRDAWAQLTDEPVAEMGLYFVATDSYHACD